MTLNLRKYKSPAEIAIMRGVARLGVLGHRALIQSTRPGVAEKALAAVFDFVTAKEGARGLAYYTIIMSGKNHAPTPATRYCPPARRGRLPGSRRS